MPLAPAPASLPPMPTYGRNRRDRRDRKETFSRTCSQQISALSTVVNRPASVIASDKRSVRLLCALRGLRGLFLITPASVIQEPSTVSAPSRRPLQSLRFLLIAPASVIQVKTFSASALRS